MNSLINKYTETTLKDKLDRPCEDYYGFWGEHFKLNEIHDFAEKIMSEIQVMNEDSYDFAEESIVQYLKEINHKFFMSLHEGEISYMCI